MKKIIHTVYVRAAPARVYGALTTAEGLAGWWSKKVTVEPGVGGLVRFTFARDFHPHMKQTALDTNRRVAWTCVDGHDNWRDNSFLFVLNEREGETVLHFEQNYARELADDVYGNYNFNWGHYLASLKMLCEQGEGTPFDSA